MLARPVHQSLLTRVITARRKDFHSVVRFCQHARSCMAWSSPWALLGKRGGACYIYPAESCSGRECEIISCQENFPSTNIWASIIGNMSVSPSSVELSWISVAGNGGDDDVKRLELVEKLSQISAEPPHAQRFQSKLPSPPDSPVKHPVIASTESLRTVWGFNSVVPERVDACIHDMISDQALRTPDAQAIKAWDGDMTYTELDSMSTYLAHSLIRADVCGPGRLTALCFEKSKWTTVGMLAVLKTGAGCVTLDPSQPEERLRTIVSQVHAKRILSGASTARLASSISGCEAFVVAEASVSTNNIEQCPIHSGPGLPSVDPSDPMAIVFTSGSTGLPKGATMTHSNFASAVRHVRERMGLTSKSRVADCASYAFDVSWSNFVHTLTVGGVLCIPSDEERKNDLVAFINRLSINYIELTPSVAAILDWKAMHKPGDLTVVLGGELVELDRIAYEDYPGTIINTYGPSETTVTATEANVKAKRHHPRSIGTGCGTTTWIVDPDDHNLLAEFGEAGELLLEGPLLGKGYLDLPEKTAACFISAPPWLLQGYPGIPGRNGKLYKTGDLVRYDEDGSIIFIGRKDSQAKLRGQRFELGEVEHHVQNILHEKHVTMVVAEIITPKESGTPILAVFLVFDSACDPVLALPDVTALINQELGKILPAYMVPSAYIPLPKVPFTLTGKVDRRALRGLGDDYVLPAMRKVEASTEEVKLSDLEVDLQSIWATVLKLDAELIRPSHSFLDLGGNSIKAMSLAVAIRGRWNVDVRAQSLLEPLGTLAGIAELISDLRRPAGAGKVNYWDLEAEVEALTCEFDRRRSLSSPTTVFLSGATGYLGLQILRQVLTSRAFQRVICLVRPLRGKNGMERLLEAVEHAGWWNAAFAPRIEVWDGDLGAEMLGLSVDRWKSLCGDKDAPHGIIDAIVHNGAIVHWTSTYAQLKAANVDSTLQLLEAAARSPFLKRFVYISGGNITSQTEHLCASDAATGYDLTKYVSERLVQKVANKSACSESQEPGKFSVVKPGYIIGDAVEGTANPDDFIWRLVSCVGRLQARPAESERTWIDISDVTSLANTIVEQAIPHRRESKEYVDISCGLWTDSFWAAVESQLGRPLQVVDWKTWLDMAHKDLKNEQEAHPLWPVQSFLHEDCLKSEPPSNPDWIVEEDTRRMQDAVKANIRYLQKRDLFGDSCISTRTKFHEQETASSMRATQRVVCAR